MEQRYCRPVGTVGIVVQGEIAPVNFELDQLVGDHSEQLLEVRMRELAIGRVTAVCCELVPGRDVRAIPIPGFIAERIEEAPD